MNGQGAFQRDCAAILVDELKRGKISRRNFLRTGSMFGIGAATGLVGTGARAQDAGSVTLVNYGGDAIEAYQVAWGEAFTAETGITLDIDGSGPMLGMVRRMVDEGNVTWDIVDAGDFYAVQLDEDYLLPIDYSLIDPNAFYEWNRFERGAGSYTYSNVLAYDSEKLAEAPTSWADFFDRERFPGKRALYKWYDGQPECIMMAAGREQVYPIDWDLVYDMIDSLGDDLVLWDSGGMSQQLFLDEEIVMGNIWNTRARILNRDTGGRVKWTWNGQIVAPGVWSVPNGAPNVAGAMQFIASSTAPEGQIMMLDMLGNGPANPAVSSMLTEEQRAIDPTTHVGSGIVHDATYYAENYDEGTFNWIDATSR